MQKLGLTAIAVAMLGLVEVGSSHLVTATQPSSTIISSTIDNHGVAKDLHSIALVGKKCTIRRYRRPR